MSIPKDSEEINTLNPETISYDENGQVSSSSVIKKHFLALLFVLVAVLSFGIGRLSATKPTSGISIKYDPSISSYQGNSSVKTKGNSVLKTGGSAAVVKSVQTEASQVNSGSEVFASSKGKRYYYPGCKSTIVEKNKITFATKEMAESAGYTLASGCKPI